MLHSSSRVLVQLLLLAWLMLGESRSLCQTVTSPADARVGYRSSRATLQFKSGSQIAEFLPEKAYLTSGGHSLTVEFLGTPGVMPKNSVNAEVRTGAVLSSPKVLYEDLWPGIRLMFSLNPKGSCEATYFLVAGADVSKIRLRYNVPVKLREDGTLRFQFSTGSVTESSPEAWQEINGERVPVKAAFTLTRGVVGFTVGSYDSRYPLIID